MSSAVPERHPDQDQLADLAAEVLPVDVARSIEAHVMECLLCERLLADAERVRRLLFSDHPDPGPMPDDVWLRLEGAMAAEAINRRRTADGAGASSGMTGWFDAPANPPSATSAPNHIDLTRPFAPEPADQGRDPHTAPMPIIRAPIVQPQITVIHSPVEPAPEAPPQVAPQVPPRVAPRVAPPQISAPQISAPRTGQPHLARSSPDHAPLDHAPLDHAPLRQAPNEQAPPPPPPPPSMSFDEAPTAAWKAFLDDPDPVAPPTDAIPLRVGRVVRASSRSRRDVRTEDRDSVRRPRSIVLAAAAASIVGVLGIGAGAFVLLHGDGDTRDDTTAFPGARSVVTSSGRDYTAASLVAQVRALLTGGAAGSASASGKLPTSGRPSASGKPSATGSGKPAGSGSPAGAGTVANPEQLTSCLVGLGEKGRRPLAVDLARYQGREAAVIVLPGTTGGFDIWVVPRQCKAGSEMPLAFKSVPK